MRAAKLAAMVLLTTLLAAALASIAMLITTRDWTEPVNFELSVTGWGWIALFHLTVFGVPLGYALEPNPSRLRWLYYILGAGVALAWTLLLDGPAQPVTYMLATLIGLACAQCWVLLLQRFDPWRARHE